MSSQMPKPLQLLMKLFDALVVIGMAVMSVMVFLNVVLRYGFNSGIPISVAVALPTYRLQRGLKAPLKP